MSVNQQSSKCGRHFEVNEAVYFEETRTRWLTYRTNVRYYILASESNAVADKEPRTIDSAHGKHQKTMGPTAVPMECLSCPAGSNTMQSF